MNDSRFGVDHSILAPIDLPEPRTRAAELWAEIFEPILVTEFPATRLEAPERSRRIVDALLARLGVYYAKVQSR